MGDCAKRRTRSVLEPIEKALKELAKPFAEKIKRRAQGQARAGTPAKRSTYRKTSARPSRRRSRKNAEAQIKPDWDEVVEAMPADVKATRAKLREQLHRGRVHRARSVADAPTRSSTRASRAAKLRAANGRPAQQARCQSSPRCRASFKASFEIPKTSHRAPHRARELACIAGESAHRARDGKSHLAVPHGQRPGAHSQRLRRRWATSRSTAACSTGWRRNSWTQGWSVKAIDRLIVTSSAYQQSSGPDVAKAKIDPDNRLFWRMNRKRFDAEMIRDAALSVAGTLIPQLGGRPVRIPIEPEVYDLIFTEHERDGLWPVHPDKTCTESPRYLSLQQAQCAAAAAVGFRSTGRDYVLPGPPGVDARAAGSVSVQLELHAGCLARLRGALEKSCGAEPDLRDRHRVASGAGPSAAQGRRAAGEKLFQIRRHAAGFLSGTLESK